MSRRKILLSLMAILLASFSLLGVGCKRKTPEGESVLYWPLVAKVKGLDPIHASDLYSHQVVAEIFEGLLQYDYLARPYALAPNVAETMPSVSKDGLTYTFKIKKGVLFHAHLAFPEGKGRELAAEDFVYSIKRIADVKNISDGWWLFDGKIKGLNEFREVTKKIEKVDYAQPVEGLKALDSRTLQITLTRKSPQFLYALAMGYSFAVPREVVEHHGAEFLNHPIGTGAFKLESWNEENKIVLARNPHYRNEAYPTRGQGEDEKNGLLTDAGKPVPFVDKVVFNIFVESQPQWLNFMKMNLDATSIPKDFFDNVINEKQELKEEIKKKGITLAKEDSLDTTFVYFNMEDPVVGGTKNKYLRQAMSLAYDGEKSAALFYNWRCTLAQFPLPPGIFGYDRNLKNPYRQYNVMKAKERLAKAGYPEGKGLPELVYEITNSTDSRQMAEKFVGEMAQLGIKIRINQNTWPELTQKVKTKKAQLFGMAWGADYPDAENFLQLFYGPNESPGANSANFRHAEYDKHYEKMRDLPDNQEKHALIQKMVQILMEETPAIWGVHRKAYTLYFEWLKNYKRHDIGHGFFKYYRIDGALREKRKKG